MFSTAFNFFFSGVTIIGANYNDIVSETTPVGLARFCSLGFHKIAVLPFSQQMLLL